VRGILARALRIAEFLFLLPILPLSSAPLSPRLHCGHLAAGDGVQHKKKKSIDPNNFFNPNSTWR
jgi:hypothetical protein